MAETADNPGRSETALSLQALGMIYNGPSMFLIHYYAQLHRMMDPQFSAVTCL